MIRSRLRQRKGVAKKKQRSELELELELEAGLIFHVTRLTYPHAFEMQLKQLNCFS